MSDMGDMYRELRGIDAEAKREQLAKASRLMGDQFEQLTPYHWRTTFAGYLFDYWPSTGAYRYRGRTEHGEPEFVAEVIRKLRAREETGARAKPS